MFVPLGVKYRTLHPSLLPRPFRSNESAWLPLFRMVTRNATVELRCADVLTVSPAAVGLMMFEPSVVFEPTFLSIASGWSCCPPPPPPPPPEVAVRVKSVVVLLLVCESLGVYAPLILCVPAAVGVYDTVQLDDVVVAWTKVHGLPVPKEPPRLDVLLSITLPSVA